MAGDGDGRDILVDVGGGIGMVLTTIINASPKLQRASSRCTLQDLQGPIEQVRAGEHLPQGVQTMAHSFFEQQPIKGKNGSRILTASQHSPLSLGAKAYYLRRILHDYSDSKCVDIMRGYSASPGCGCCTRHEDTDI